MVGVWLLGAACSIPSVDVHLIELHFSCGSGSLHNDISPVTRLATWLTVQPLSLLLCAIKCVDFGIYFPVPADCLPPGHKEKAAESPSLPSVPFCPRAPGVETCIGYWGRAGEHHACRRWCRQQLQVPWCTHVFRDQNVCLQCLTLRVPPAHGPMLM